ncbi:hypothetical protein PsorP6_010567 [Peronosclerospora sorghi]|uniref:Uncharacterized protein n=1 Tax=Peronosclerospora sorghi TaxID=230839 RepID=A0ACC0VX65_9STRA|nr:hypothetical protein PsorP6_010567 [Peronosclerospora sorghi]
MVESSWRCFDIGSSVHLTEFDRQSVSEKVKGVAATTVTKASGIGRVMIVTSIEETEVEVFLDDILR